MLKMQDVGLSFNDGSGDNREILREINLEFSPGKLYGITGPNGGGKTSLAKVIMGIYKNTEGKVIFENEDISDLGVTERAKKGIAYAFQQPPRFKGINTGDLLKLAYPGIELPELMKHLRDVGLCPEDYMERDVGPGLSGGEIKRIEISQVLARNATVSIFDEPEAGVDLWTIQKLIGILISRYKNNMDNTAIIITHNEKILPVCDEIVVLEEGEVRMAGTPQNIWPAICSDILCKRRNDCRGEDGYEV